MAKPYRNHLAKSSGRKIRVFDLEPAPRSSSDRISGALREIPLDGRRRYDALSYVWGRDKQIFDVHCGEVTLSVTQNCHDALKRLRDTTRTRTLWIDTICINQSDDDEKSHQVAMMLDIYRNADRVYIWLGEGTHGSDYALDWCLDVPQQVVAFINTMFKITPYEYSGIWRGRERPNHILGIILKRKLQLLLELTLRFVGTGNPFKF
jgi:hypothetical protein